MRHVEESLTGELVLLDPAVRASQQAIDELLHPDFSERGQSGRWWSPTSSCRRRQTPRFGLVGAKVGHRPMESHDAAASLSRNDHPQFVRCR